MTNLPALDWDESHSATQMLRLLGAKYVDVNREAFPVSERKLRLWACACYWLTFHSHLMLDRECVIAVEAAEAYADRFHGPILDAGAYRKRLDKVRGELSRHSVPLDRDILMAWRCCWRNPWTAASAIAAAPDDAIRANGADLLREIVGNPFRLAQLCGEAIGGVDRCEHILRWNDACVLKMSRSIYDGRRFYQMPILADALEDAGCVSQEILDHCRAPGPVPHYRGCWVLDLLLGLDVPGESAAATLQGDCSPQRARRRRVIDPVSRQWQLAYNSLPEGSDSPF